MLALLLAALQTAPAPAQELRPLTAEAVLDMADRRFGMAQEAGGAVVVTVVKGGQVLFMKGYGLANPKTASPVDPAATLFRIGSVTKVFTAITALQLIERGVIDPGANVNTYLSKIGVRIDDRFREPVTMRDLLALRAGRFDWTYSYYYPIHDDDNARLPPDEISRRLWRTARPGDVAAYDNNGVGLIGFVAEAAAGRPYRDLVRTGVLEPLGMSRSVAGVPRSRVPEMAGCSDANPATAYQSCPYDLIAEHLRPSGDMTVTAADMGRFMTAVLAGGRLGDVSLLSPSGWARFVDFDAHELDPRLPAWGQVIYESFAEGRYAYGHDGGVGKFGTMLRIYPGPGVGLFVSVQSGLDWAYPASPQEGLSDLMARPPAPTPAPAMIALGRSRTAFESDFTRAFIPASGPPGAGPDPSLAPIPIGDLGGRYWRQLGKGKRFLLVRVLERLEPTIDVSVLGADHLRVTMPGSAGREYRRSAVNAFRAVDPDKTLVFAASARGVNANWTDGSALYFLSRLPWHYRPWVTVYPLPVALLVLLTALGYFIVRRRSPADRRLAATALIGCLLVTLGLLAELQLAMSQLYHGGRIWSAVAWRSSLHAGAAVLLLVPVLAFVRRGELVRTSSGGLRPGKAAYLAVLSLAAVVTVVLVGYWGLLGHFTT